MWNTAWFLSIYRPIFGAVLLPKCADCNLLFVGHGAVDLDVYCLVFDTHMSAVYWTRSTAIWHACNLQICKLKAPPRRLKESYDR